MNINLFTEVIDCFVSYTHRQSYWVNISSFNVHIFLQTILSCNLNYIFFLETMSTMYMSLTIFIQLLESWIFCETCTWYLQNNLICELLISYSEIKQHSPTEKQWVPIYSIRHILWKILKSATMYLTVFSINNLQTVCYRDNHLNVMNSSNLQNI